jgi:gas vesicle protein
MKMKTTTTKMIMGMAVAAAAGAAIGMLLAPEKGADLQKRVREGFRSFMDDISGLLSAGKELADKTTGAAEDMADEAKSNLRRIEE